MEAVRIIKEMRVAPLTGCVDRNWLTACGWEFHPRSLPSRDAWIEILAIWWAVTAHWSLPSRDAWIEIAGGQHDQPARKSLPSRDAWIEMKAPAAMRPAIIVAPLTGCVDRNILRPLQE